MAGRKSGEPLPERFQIGDWQIGRKDGRIQRAGKVESVRPLAMKVLVYLAERAPELVPVDELIENVWAPRVVGDDAVAVVISDLRKKLQDDTRNPKYIETIPKRGYRIVASVEAKPKSDLLSSLEAVLPPFPSYKGDRPYVFVCYAHVDRREIYPELVRLKKTGVNIWYDEGISPGSEWTEELANAISRCTQVLYYVSPASVASRNCRDEVQFALKHGKPVVTVHTEPTELPGSLELSLGATQALLKYEITPADYERKLLAAIDVEGKFLATSATRPQTAVRKTSRIRSIAVLPLENLSGDPGQEYVADGMTEALIGELAKLGSLNVISRTSVMRYKGSDKSLPTIASELGVDGVLEGTVIREEGQVRVTAQLIDARTDTHIWNDRFDRELSGVLALYADVARAVAEEIRLELTPQQKTLLTATRTVDPDAYDAYLRGLQIFGPHHQVRSWGPPAIAHLERAVELDPKFAKGWARLASTRAALAEMCNRNEFPKVRTEAERALALDRGLVAAHVALHVVLRNYDWDFVGARRRLERATELGPNDPGVLRWTVYDLLDQGKTEDALRASERLPLAAPLELIWRTEHAKHFYYTRHYEAALKEFERVQELWPDFGVPNDVSPTYHLLNRFDEAMSARIAYLEQAAGEQDALEREAIERGWAEGGWEGAERARLDHWIKLERSPVIIAWGYAGFGETDEAFAWLERGYKERDHFMITEMPILPWSDPLRSDPRFEDLVRRMGRQQVLKEPGVLAGSGMALALQGRSSEAIASLEEALECGPSDVRRARWLYYVAMAYFAAERYQQATVWANRSLKLDPGMYTSTDAQLLLTTSHAHLGNSEQAQQALAEGLRQWPNLKSDLVPLPLYTDSGFRERYVEGLRTSGLEN